MQSVELVLLATLVLVTVAYFAAQFARRGSADHPLGRLLLGLIPASIAVMLVITFRLDVVPDELEQPLWIATIVVVTGVLIVGTSYRLARR